MTVLLHVDASARGERSLSRQLSRRFIDEWVSREPSSTVLVRNVGHSPPPFVSEAWIAAVFAPEVERTAEQRELLRPSDELISELARAEIIVMGTPMYNYGMPATLKAWFDQVIRIGKTFSFDLRRGDFPLEPIMGGKRLVVLASRGEFGFEADGVRAHMNHLETHIRTCAHYLGVTETHVIAIEYQEFGGERHLASQKAAHKAVSDLVAQLHEAWVG